MFYEISVYVKNNMIEVNGQDFLLGKLTESCLNISSKEYDFLRESITKIMNLISAEDEINDIYGGTFNEMQNRPVP